MIAEELFNKEGFKQEKYMNSISYTSYYDNKDSFDSIIFCDQLISIFSQRNSNAVYPTLNINVFKAINKQIEELGWEEE